MIECLLRVATYTRKITFVFGAIVFCLLQGKRQSAGELHHLHHEQQAEEQKCLCDMAASSTSCASASFGASNKKSGAFRKTATNAPPFPTTLSFLFNVLATGFLCFSSPVPASHYKYDEHTAAAKPPLFPLIAQAPLLSFAIAEALLSPSWTTQKGFNQIL